jgi:glutamyl-tRNA synthetase
MSGVRARFAPSPTGMLHLGSARTALLNWLFVRTSGGELLLRIDDTDAERSDRELEARILEDLSWLGLEWDLGPVRQSERAERYREALETLPVERRDGAYVFEDRVIARADGSALYHLATAVDDVDDAITHVLRGRDHLANAELQSALIRAIGAEPPVYVHAPLLIFDDGAKVSKREGDRATVAELRKEGFTAAALLNALALSLADFGTEELMFSAGEIAGRFELDRLHTADSRFDEAKLRWISGEHLRAMELSEFAAALADFGAGDLPEPALLAAQTGGQTLVECTALARMMVEPPPPDDAAIAAIDQTEVGVAYAVLDELVESWPPDVEQAKQVFAELKRQLKADGYNLGVCLRGLRAVFTGRTEGPEFPLLLACIDQSRWEAAGYYHH